MAAAGVVGVLLPTATLTTGGRWDSARVLREAGVTLALGTDCNPGTSWCESVPYALQLAGPLLGLGVDEALRAATVGGAAALRRTDVGQLRTGAHGDLAVLAAEHEADLMAHLGAPAVAPRWSAACRSPAPAPSTEPAHRAPSAGDRRRAPSSDGVAGRVTVWPVE